MPYRIEKANDPNLRRQITDAVNMAAVQTTIGATDKLTVPSDCQSIVFGTMTVAGQLTIEGELVVTDYP